MIKKKSLKKEFILLLAATVVFLFCSIRSPLKLRKLKMNRVYFMVVPGLLGLRENFKTLMREVVIGFVVCLMFVTRIYLFTLKDADHNLKSEDKVLLTFIIQFIAISFYKFYR